jgi:hypothetical protein
MEALKKKLEQISPYLDEKQRRLIYAAEAIQLGRGGKAVIHKLYNAGNNNGFVNVGKNYDIGFIYQKY